MSSTESRAPAQVAPPAPVFSYAQAAKGRATTTGTSSSQISQATSGISTPAKETHSPMFTASISNSGTAAGAEAVEKIANGTFDPVTKADPLGLGLESESKSSALIPSTPASPSYGTASTSTLSKEDDLTIPGTTPVESV